MPNLANLPVADLQAGTGNWSGQGYIEGLKMVWNSATSLSVTSGAAFIPSLSKCLQSPSAITKSGLSLAASTWYHVYLYLNAGTPDIEIVTTAPAAPYNGTARTKTGDTSRRYVGSVLTDASANIWKFLQHGLRINYLENIGSTAFTLATGFNAITPTTIGCSSLIPSTSKLGHIHVSNNDSAQIVVANSEANFTLSGAAWLYLCGSTASPGVTRFGADFPLDSSQAFTAMYAGTPSSTAAFRCIGYTYER